MAAAMTPIEELRASMRSAQVFGKGQYFEPGLYLLEVKNLFYKKSLFQGTSKENIIAEFTVLESSNKDIAVGSTRSEVFTFSKAGWLGRFKAMLTAILDAQDQGSEDNVADVYAALMYDAERERLGYPENWLAGWKVRGEGIMIETKEKKIKLCSMQWTPFKEAA